MALEGLCRISQSDFGLAEHVEHAVTRIAGGDTWRISKHPGPPGSNELIIALTSGPLTESSSVVQVLTLGEKTEEQGIQVYVRPIQSPPSPNQLWTLQDVMATKRFPPLAHARIESKEYPELSMGTGVLHRPLPRVFINVAAADKGEGDQMWKLDFLLPEE